jgi:hypothetical protein
MALLTPDQNQPQAGGLLSDLDPSVRAMIAMSLLSKFANNNRGSQSGFGDIFNVMMQAQQLKRQALQDALAREQFGLEKEKFGLTQKLTNAQIANYEREAREAQTKQAMVNSIASGIENYQAPVPQVAPVIEEYQDMQAGNQNFQIPTENYMNNVFQAVDEASKAPRQSEVTEDPRLREIYAAAIRTGDPAVINNALNRATGSDRFVLKPGEEAHTPGGKLIASNRRTTAEDTFNEEIYRKQKAIEARTEVDKETITESRRSARIGKTALNIIKDIRGITSKVNPHAVGPFMGKYGHYTDEDVQELESHSNKLALLSKTIYNMPSNTFTDADRDYIDRIAGGKKVSLNILHRIIDKMEENIKIAIEQNALDENEFSQFDRILSPQERAAQQKASGIRKYNKQTGRIE